MNNINWKIRFKNKHFWFMMFLAVTSSVGQLFGVTGLDVTTWDSLFEIIKLIITNPFALYSIFAAIYNAVIDPTTKGISDSNRALDYEEPHKD